MFLIRTCCELGKEHWFWPQAKTSLI